MKVTGKIAELQQSLSERGGGILGLVPTMGALHAGHLSLVQLARKQCDMVAVSIFVNPTQFNDKNDLRNYPRTPREDIALLEQAGIDIVFMPSEQEMYPQPDTRVFDFGNIDKVMEGATRPGHFNGVAQIVSRLFDIVKPDKAYFGQKDFQQIAVIRAMVAQLGLDLQIVECPIVRGEDGLALSSRNALLDRAHRAAAPEIYAALKKGVQCASSMSPDQVVKMVTDTINSNPLLDVIYFKIVDAESLEDVSDWAQPGSKQGCVAVQAGNVRLIDNIRFV